LFFHVKFAIIYILYMAQIWSLN